MLATIILAAEVLILIGTLVDFSRLRIVAGRDFTTVRKLVALQAVLALVVVIFLQLAGTAQSQQHDGASKNIAGRLGAAIQTYTANSNTVTGFTCTSQGYCSGIVDPDTFAPPKVGTVATSSSGVVYALGKNCLGAHSPTAYAIYYWQERPSGHSQCLDAS